MATNAHCEPASQEAVSRATRHPTLYLDDGSITLLVENTLFKIHRSFLLKHSQIFRDMLSVPVPDSAPEGLDDEHPISLPGVTCKTFEDFLYIFYPRSILAQPVGDGWLSILECAERWQCDEIQSWAVAQVTALNDPIIQVLAGRRVNDQTLLRKGFDGFARRKGFLSPEESSRLCGAEIVNLTRYREETRNLNLIHTPSESYDSTVCDVGPGGRWFRSRSLDDVFRVCSSYVASV